MKWKYGNGKFKGALKWLIWSGVLAGVSTGGVWLTYFLVLNRPKEPVAVRLLTVKRDNIETTINESGTVELREQRILKSPKEGAVERVLVKPGDKVKSGQQLLTLRYPERNIAIANQQLQIQQQELTLERNREKIAEAKEDVKAEEKQLQQIAPLAQQGAIAQQEIQKQEDAVRKAKVTVRDAEAQARTDALKLKSLQLERQGIRQQLQDSIVTAPLDGIVLGINVKDGDGVEVRTNLLTLGDPRQVLMKLQLSTLNAARIHVNQLARVTTIGPDTQTFTGRVQSLYLQALTPEEIQKESGTQNKSDQATVPATVLLDTPTRTLIPGSRVNVEIILEKRQNVVVLNTEAVQRSEGQPFVWVQDSQNQAQKRPIKLGLEGLITVEVASGLHAGEQILLPPAESQLQPGTPVKISEK